MRRPLVLLALTGAALAAAPAEAGSKRTIKIADNYFSPKKVTVKKNTTIVWKWQGEGGDVHDVKLSSAPKGVKRFQSDPASSEYTFRRKLSRPGTYKILCTFHEDDDMRMTVVVRRK